MSTPANPLGATPTTVTVLPLSTIGASSTRGSPANASCQSA